MSCYLLSDNLGGRSFIYAAAAAWNAALSLSCFQNHLQTFMFSHC